MAFSTRTSELIYEQLLSTKKLINFFRLHCGVYAYMCYGTLLGAIRENNVISYDNDVDIAYISKYSTLPEIRQELYHISEVLIEHGLLGKIWIKRRGILHPTVKDLDLDFAGQMHVRTPDNLLYIDVFSSWVTNNKFYLTPHLYGEIDKADIVPFTSEKIRDIDIVAPKNSRLFLESIYGKEWVKPIKSKKSFKEKKWMNDYK